MRMKQQGANPVELLILAGSWYGAKPDPQLASTAKLWPVGNEFYGKPSDAESALDRAFFTEMPTEDTLAKLTRALDDLRRLGELDLRLNHP